MTSQKSLIYAVGIRAVVLVAYFYKYRVLPSLTSGLIGLVLGLAGGVYLDRSRSERDISDNLTFGLILSAIFRYADIYYSITALTPESYRRGIVAVSIAAMLAALSSETTIGRPGKIPILGMFAVILAFVLVFSAVTSTSIPTITRYSGGSYSGVHGFQGFEMAVKFRYSNGTEVLIRQDVPNATSYTLSLSYTDSVGQSANAVKYFYVPIRSNRSVTVDGEEFRPVVGDIITIVASFGTNVSKPKVTLLYILPGGITQKGVSIDGNASLTNTSFTRKLEVSSTIKLATALYVMIERTDLGSDYYPATPLVVSIERKISEREAVNTSYIVAAIVALGIAVIDALPFEDKPKPKTRKRKKRR